MEEIGQWPTDRLDSVFMNERPLRAMNRPAGLKIHIR